MKNVGRKEGWNADQIRAERKSEKGTEEETKKNEMT